MKINNFFFPIEVDFVLIIVVLSSLLSKTIAIYLSAFYLCYLFILFHEFSHILFASLFGYEVKKMKLSLSGVCVSFNKEINSEIYLKNILIYFAGPASNYILALIFHNNSLIFSLNIFLGTLNLFPIYPLDGYNVLKILLNYKVFSFNKINIEFIRKCILYSFICIWYISDNCKIKYFYFNIFVLFVYFKAN